MGGRKLYGDSHMTIEHVVIIIVLKTIIFVFVYVIDWPLGPIIGTVTTMTTKR